MIVSWDLLEPTARGVSIGGLLLSVVNIALLSERLVSFVVLERLVAG